MSDLVKDLKMLAKMHQEEDLIDISETIEMQAADRIEQLGRENERLKGVKPELPPFPPNGSGLPRYGISWNGQYEPITKPMDDGYWTPWHLADEVKQERDELAAHVERLREGLNDAIEALVSETMESGLVEESEIHDLRTLELSVPQTSLAEVRVKQAEESFF